MLQTRRDFLAAVSSAGTTGLAGTLLWFAQEAPPETTTIRIKRSFVEAEDWRFLKEVRRELWA
jgi:hypothetical protein